MIFGLIGGTGSPARLNIHSIYFGTFTMDAFVCALGIRMRNENHYVQTAPEFS